MAGKIGYPAASPRTAARWLLPVGVDLAEGQPEAAPGADPAARRGEDLPVRGIQYEIPDRDGDGKDQLIALVTKWHWIMIAATAPLCGHTSLTCTSKPKITNYSCRTIRHAVTTKVSETRQSDSPYHNGVDTPEC